MTYSKEIEWEYTHKSYLHQKTVVRRKFDLSKTEHRHCEFCWAKFSHAVEDLHDGYYEATSSSWICPDCKAIYENIFGWTVIEVI